MKIYTHNLGDGPLTADTRNELLDKIDLLTCSEEQETEIESETSSENTSQKIRRNFQRSQSGGFGFFGNSLREKNVSSVIPAGVFSLQA